ncbi:amidase signature domain-containing protein [Jackrogersella minutella]|nr:amidase signature domain-containing protein [Jackrogersella minutella]
MSYNTIAQSRNEDDSHTGESSSHNTIHATTIVSIGGSGFILQFEFSISVTPPGGPERYIPTTVLDCGDGTTNFDDTEMNRMCHDFTGDDIWTKAFLELLIIQCSSRLTISTNLRPRAVKLVNKGKRVPIGPYIVHTPTGKVYSLFKCWRDTNNAFVRGVLPKGETDGYTCLDSIDQIPVPSKLYHTRTDTSSPLHGMRFGVKDSIDIAGLKTGCGSKCYRSSYPARNSSAPFINHLITAGAIMVGKTRCCQWCDGQDPQQRLEEVSPTNPRGDTFQKPSSSSSGSATGAASYSWLDFTIGTDTGGSIRHPAGVNGVYGIRPSLGSVSSSGLVCSKFMDTPGVFARSAAIATAVARVMTHESLTGTLETPKNIQYKLLYAIEPDSSDPSETPKFFSRGGKGPEFTTSAGIIFEGFVRQLEQHLHCKREEICIFDRWRTTRPKAAPENLVEATSTIYQNLVYHELWHGTVGPFVQDYQAAHSGRMPFIEAITKARLEYGARVSETDYEESVATLTTYATWVHEVLLPPPSTSPNTSNTHTIPLLVYPQSWGTPHYRDDVSRPKDHNDIFWRGFSNYSMSYCSGCPDVTIPLGEVNFRSKVTETEEYLPVAISILAPRGEDEVLWRLMEELEERRILRPVECGSRLWQEGT